jgi:hypothetical protein
MAPVGVRRGVARLAEAFENVNRAQRARADDRDRAELGVRDDGEAADRLDAPRLVDRRHMAQHAAAGEVDDDEPVLEIRGDERHAA